MNELRQAVRRLTKEPGFTLTAILTLALGVGATTTIFSVVDHLMLRDLPFPDADRVVTLWQQEGTARIDVAPGNYIDWKERSRSFAVMGASEPYSFDLTGEGRPEVIIAALVTDGFFEALGARPYLGRLLAPEDFRENAASVAVLGHGLWQRRFGGDATVVGRALILDGRPVTVVGIVQPDFDLGMAYSVTKRELWLPRQFEGWERTSRSSSWWTVVGRLAPGVSLAQARDDMNRVARELSAEYPASNQGVGVAVLPLREHLVGSARPALLLLLVGVVLVLLVACVNVANLQLARGAERAREFAVRAAIGASRRHLVRQLLTETLVLAGVGTVAGVSLAFWAVDLVKALAPPTIPRFDTVALDPRVLGFAAGLALLTTFIAGLAPALRLARPNLGEVMAEGRATAGRARLRLREGLIIAEIALALGLLVGAGLLLRSFATLLAVDPGFQRDKLAALQIFYYENDHTPQDRAEFFTRTLREIRALPGVRSAGAVSAAPFLAANIDLRRVITFLDRPAPRAGDEPEVYVTTATPDYFTAMGIPLLRGRGLEESDRFDTPRVAVINETLRRSHFPDQDPIGRQIRLGTSATSAPLEIVGVVGDVRHTGLDAPPRPELFIAQGQTGSGSMTYFIRAEGDPAALIKSVQEVVWSIAPLQTFYQTGTVDRLIAATLVGRRFTLVLLSVFAGLGLLLAAVGTYGVISFSVSRRTREVGIRMALGARRDAVVRMIVRRGVALGGAGIAIGLLLTLLATPLMQDLLFVVSPRDTFAFAGGALVLLGAAALASWVPARRAARIDPMEALRVE